MRQQLVTRTAHRLRRGVYDLLTDVTMAVERRHLPALAARSAADARLEPPDPDVPSVKGAATRAPPGQAPIRSGIEKRHGVVGLASRWKAGMTPSP
jgi:hypothetical protein